MKDKSAHENHFTSRIFKNRVLILRVALKLNNDFNVIYTNFVSKQLIRLNERILFHTKRKDTFKILGAMTIAKLSTSIKVC